MRINAVTLGRTLAAMFSLLGGLSANIAYADSCSQVISGASTAFYQGRYGSAGGDGYCHARTGNEPNTSVPINSQADCQRLTGNLFVEFDPDRGKNFRDCIFQPSSGGGAREGGGGGESDASKGLKREMCLRRKQSFDEYVQAVVSNPSSNMDDVFRHLNDMLDSVRRWCPPPDNEDVVRDAQEVVRDAQAKIAAPRRDTAPPSNATYTIRVCNNGGGGAAWVALLAYLVPDSQNPWKKGWWHVPDRQCVNALTLPFGNHSSRSFWTFAQFDNGQFWPKQILDTSLTQYRWCVPQQPSAASGFTREVVLGDSYPCGGEALRFFQEGEAIRSSQGDAVVTLNIVHVEGNNDCVALGDEIMKRIGPGYEIKYSELRRKLDQLASSCSLSNRTDIYDKVKRAADAAIAAAGIRPGQGR